MQSQQTEKSGGGVEHQRPLPAAAATRLRFLLVVTELGQGACAFHAVEKIILKYIMYRTIICNVETF